MDNETVGMTEEDAIKLVALRIAEQNKLVLDSIKMLGDATLQIADAFVKLTESLAALNIVINVPEQPAPVIQVNVPEMTMPAPKVTVNAPEEGERSIDLKMTKDNKGNWTVKGTEK